VPSDGSVTIQGMPPPPQGPVSREAAFRLLSSEELADAFIVCLRRGRMRGWSLTSQLSFDEELRGVLEEFRRRLYDRAATETQHGSVVHLPPTHRCLDLA
jgi:hypothetical protein